MKASEKVTHTPGPWERSPVSSVVGSLISYGDISKGMSVCSVIPQLSNEVTAANADLIAAAPEMLAALEKAHLYFLQDNGLTADDREILDEMWAAIRKAKGEK